jgi:hypothetical protein
MPPLPRVLTKLYRVRTSANGGAHLSTSSSAHLSAATSSVHLNTNSSDTLGGAGAEDNSGAGVGAGDAACSGGGAGGGGDSRAQPSTSAATAEPQAQQRDQQQAQTPNAAALVAARPFSVHDLYDFGRTLGVGSFGDVRLAIHRHSSCHVAVKTSLKSSLTSSRLRHRAEMEWRLQAWLDHPNIAKVVHVAETATQLFIAQVRGGRCAAGLAAAAWRLPYVLCSVCSVAGLSAAAGA